MAILFLIVFVDLVGFGLIIPLLPFYGEHFHASPATVGLLMAIYSLAQFLAAPMWGRLSDRVGRKPVLALSLAGATLVLPVAGLRARSVDAVRRPRARRLHGRQHRHRLRLRRRCHHPGQPGEGDGHGRCGVRSRLHLRTGHRWHACRPRSGECRLHEPGAGGSGAVRNGHAADRWSCCRNCCRRRSARRTLGSPAAAAGGCWRRRCGGRGLAG